MIERGGGRIINIGSLTTGWGVGNLSVYGLTKSAIGQMTRVMAVEWAPHDIQVNCLCPGWIKTELTRPLWSDPAKSAWITDRVPTGPLRSAGRPRRLDRLPRLPRRPLHHRPGDLRGRRLHGRRDSGSRRFDHVARLLRGRCSTCRKHCGAGDDAMKLTDKVALVSGAQPRDRQGDRAGARRCRRRRRADLSGTRGGRAADRAPDRGEGSARPGPAGRRDRGGSLPGDRRPDRRDLGQLDVLVNNAGGSRGGPLERAVARGLAVHVRPLRHRGLPDQPGGGAPHDAPRARVDHQHLLGALDPRLAAHVALRRRPRRR